MELELPARRLRAVHRRMLDTYGPQHWWPAETPFEVLVGAVLTQNTAWSNVEKAISNLREEDALEGEAILALPPPRLAELLRPSGYFNVKAQRLRALCSWVVESGGLATLGLWPTDRLRSALLAVHGIGPETADDILLYAFGRPTFVIDAYTRRLFARLALVDGSEPYESLRAACERALGPDVPLFNEYHALVVRHARERCTARRPACRGCCLRRLCPGVG